MRAPKFAIDDLVRSRINPSEGWIVTAFVQRLSEDGKPWTQYLCADSCGVETIRNAGELEAGAREKDPCAVD